MSVPSTQMIDPWSYFDYKESFRKPPASDQAPSWVGDEMRRLDAYRLLESYYRNSARFWLNPNIDQAIKDNRREYGDPYMMIESILSSVLGSDQVIRVEGVQDEQSPLGPVETPPEGEEAVPPEPVDLGPASLQQNTLDEWAKKERFLMKLIENERTGVKLGDMCYVLGWDTQKKRVRLRVYNPGFYFPVLDDWDNEDDWPRKVHIAWEYEREKNGNKKKFLRRKTWEIVETEDDRNLPWNTMPVRETCFMSEYEWDMDDVKNGLNDLSIDNAIEIMAPTDLEIDYVPVVHIPNTVSEEEHYGTSSIAQVMQIFDDLTATDTDLQAAGSTAGTPMLSVKGSVRKDEDGNVAVVGPGAVVESENGAELLSTATALDPLLKQKDALQDRLSVNGRTPNTLIGRIDPSKVPSGIVLTLSFQPHSNMVRQMRLVREDKYDLLLKFVSRFYMKAGVINQVLPAHLNFGSYLPADKQEITGIINQLVGVHGLSLETAVALLIEAGFPIEDAQQEVDRIRRENFDAAQKAVEATADINVGRKMLGLPEIPMTLPGEPDTTGTDTTVINPLLNPDQVPPPFPTSV